MLHTRHGYWLEEAGPVEAQPPLEGQARADVAIVGGGYLGLWTAWQLKQLEPGADVVVLDAELCGHGPSGRNGGFVSTLWGDLPGLLAQHGRERALAVARASEEAVRGIGAWCAANGVDAWFREAPHLEIATTPAQDGAWAPVVEAARSAGLPDEVVELDADEVRAVCAAPVFRGGARYRAGATVHPARLALGLRARLLELGVRVHESTRATRVRPDGVVETAGGRVTAGAVVLAVNSALAGFPGFRARLAVASSHVVVTEPVPDVLEELGWTGGEGLSDCRTLLHYFRTTPDGRIVFGWGGGAIGFGGRAGGRLEVDPDVVQRTRAALLRFFPGLRGRRVTHAWGGPIDVSPVHVPVFGSRGRVHHGYGFTGNGVGPSYLGGEILARLALDRRDGRTALALVEPGLLLFPPEPLRYAGAAAIRRALVAKDAAEDEGGRPGRAVELVASLPRRLGLHLPR